MANLCFLTGRAWEDANGNPYPAAVAHFYVPGTTTDQDSYTTAALSVANANPVVSDASTGIWGDIYLAAKRYKIVIKDASANTLKTIEVVDATTQLIASASAPSPTYPFLRYHNTGDGHVYRRNAADNAWIDEGAVDSLGNASTVTEALAGTGTASFLTPNSSGATWKRGTDIASASTLSLPSTGGGTFNVTGTTTITAIGSAVGGREVELTFAGSLQLTHNASSFILLDGVNERVRAGDVYTFRNDAAEDASGSNWRCTKRALTSGSLVFAKTASFTVDDTYRNALVRVSGLAADCTITMPAAATRSGFEFTVSYESGFADNVANTTPYGIIWDPNGAELLDGFANRKTYGNRIKVRSDGTGWRTVEGRYRYFSGNQTITSAGALVLAHGIGVRPNNIWVFLQCTTAEGGYTQFDIIPMSIYFVDATGYGASIVPDATNLNVRFASSASAFQVPNKGTGAAVAITNASWRVQFYAEE